MALNLFARKQQNSKPSATAAASVAGPPSAVEPSPRTADDDPLQQVFSMGRLGLIATQEHRWANHPLFQKIHRAAIDQIDAGFGLVPEGYASISLSIHDGGDAPEQNQQTEPFLLARRAVSNEAYQAFVDHGGYQDLELWPETIWPHLIDLTDLTGQPGPRFWQRSRHPRKQGNHPVVGVCFYEAAAYARWAGFRLPTEAEWQMAATWCIRSAAHTVRRYPWGDAFDVRHCNIWASGHGGTLPVDACPSGASPNGVIQLIGNVWEWTASEFTCQDGNGQQIVGDALMMGIRGGAFDTYFPWQAASMFRTGMVCLLRPDNIGFRCAMNLPSTED